MKKLFFIAMLICSVFISIEAQNVSTNCYRGFADVGYTFGIGDYNIGQFEINTSHGYQINPYIFLGAGIGLYFMSSYETSNMNIALDIRESKVDIPVFANARFNFLKNKISPFIDLKGGTYITNNGGLYINASLGCRIATNKKQAINISIGYTLSKLEFETFNKFTNNVNMSYNRYGRKLDAESIGIKIGYEF